MRLFVVPAFAISLLLSHVPLAAQESLSGIQSEQNIDIRGFEIGMTVPQTLAIFSKNYPNANPRLSEARHRETGQTYTNIVSLNSPEESVLLFFTGHYSGNRLYSIKREVKYRRDKQASFSKTKRSILEKYGLPSFASNRNTMTYVFGPEMVSFGSPDVVQKLIDEEKSGSSFLALAREGENGNERYLGAIDCGNMIARVQRTQFFDPVQATGKTQPNCTAAMTVELRGNNDLLQKFTISLADFEFVLSAAAIDQARAKELVTPQKPTAKAPEL